mgnify:CR=1 FL=1
MDAVIFYNTLDQLFAEKKTQEAESYMKNTLQQAEAQSDLQLVVTVCNELGGYYRYTSRYDQAVCLYDRALTIIEELGQRKTPACGTTLINYATTCNMMGELNKALVLEGITLMNSGLYTQTLEDYFKNITGGEGIA